MTTMAVRARDTWIAIALFVGLVALQVVFYAPLATSVHRLLGGDEAPGSSMGYFRYTYVAPAALALVAASAAALFVAARSGRLVFWRTLVVVGVVDLLCLVGSAEWYFRVIGHAGSYTSG
jgi:hypothetical protein